MKFSEVSVSAKAVPLLIEILSLLKKEGRGEERFNFAILNDMYGDRIVRPYIPLDLIGRERVESMLRDALNYHNKILSDHNLTL